jgi:hypothetical protein
LATSYGFTFNRFVKSSSMRLVILHHHIFKNAGSTLDSVLAREFNNDFVEFHTDVSDSGRVYPGQLLLYLDKNPNVKAVSSHHFFGQDFYSYLDYVQRNRYAFVDFILLRHPISRLASIYLYYQGVENGENPLQIFAKNHNFSAFIQYVIDKHPNFSINPQVTIFGGDRYGVPPANKQLDHAIERMLLATGLGLVEQYDKSMVVAEYFLQPLFPSLELNGKSQNISARTGIANYDGSLESIEREIGSVLFKEICRLNELDIQLWSAVSEEIERRKSFVPNYEERLKSYKSRSLD